MAQGELDQSVAAAIAVLEPHATVGRVAVLTAAPAAAVRAAVDRLVAAGTLSPDSPLRFADGPSRQATYDAIPVPVRASLHAEVADMLQHQRHVGTDYVRHVLLSEPAGREDRVRLLRDAARSAHAAGRVIDAVTYLRRALREPAGRLLADVLVELGEAELEMAPDEGCARLTEALDAIDQPDRRVRVLGELTQALTLHGRGEEALDWALSEHARVTDAQLRLRLDTLIAAAALMVPEQLALALERIGTFVLLPGSTPAEREALALSCLAAPTASTAVELAKRALHDGEFAAEQGAASMWLYRTIATLARSGAVGEARTAIDAVSADETDQSALAVASSRWCRSTIRMLAGDVVGARADAETAVDRARPGGWALGAGMSAAAHVDAALAAGDLRAAEEVVAGVASPLGSDVPAAWFRFARARTRLARGRLRDAAADLEVLVAGSSAPVTAWTVPLWPAYVRVLLADGEPARATTVAAEGLAGAQAWGGVLAISAALRAVAAACGDRDRPEPLMQAWALTEDGTLPLERAQIGVELGASLRRVGSRAQAVEVLEQALELADSGGAFAITEAARRELHTLGKRPRRSRRAGPHSLTAREWEIADLAGSGLSNEEIAGTLHVTVKTVETHLTRAYKKLGVTGRTTLSSALRSAPNSAPMSARPG